MNGSEYDRILEDLTLTEALADMDTEKFCKNIVEYLDKIDAHMREYNYITEYSNFFKMNEEIFDLKLLFNIKNELSQVKYDDEQVETARYYLSIMKQFYLEILYISKNRYLNSINKHINSFKIKSKYMMICQQILQITIIMGATTVPFILNINEIPKAVPTVISTFVAVAAALSNYYKFGRRSINLQLEAEKIQRECNWYESERGRYSKLTPGAALDLFMDQIDEIRHESNEISIMLEESMQDQIKGQEQNNDKPYIRRLKIEKSE